MELTKRQNNSIDKILKRKITILILSNCTYKYGSDSAREIYETLNLKN